MTAPVLAASLVLLALAHPGAAAETGPGDALAECKAVAPWQQSCSILVVPTAQVTLEIPHDLAYSGTLVIKGAQNGVVVWNGTCIVPLGFFDTGIGFCQGEDERVALSVPLNLTVHVGTYGVGTYGLRAFY